MLSKIKKGVAAKLKKRKVFREVQKSFLLSDEYKALMSKHLPFPGTYDMHEAQNETKNYLYRHAEVNEKLGIFRWRGMQKHMQLILDTIDGISPDKVIDLGGAACPLGFNSTIVDFLEKDAWGRKVPYKYIENYPNKVDVVFTSHTLEHIDNLEEVLGNVHQQMNNGAKFIAHIPSFYCERWRVGIHKNRSYNDHAWTFGLAETEAPKSLKKYKEIDTLLARFFNLEIVEYCGDDSIFIFGEKKNT